MGITDFLQENGVVYREHGEHHHVTYGWINIDCPWCSPNSNHFRMGFNLENNYFSCWVCGYCKLYQTLTELSGKSFPEIKQQLNLPKWYGKYKSKIPGRLKIPDGLGPLYPLHKDYLRNRGFDDTKVVPLWGLRAFGPHPRFNWRIWIPVHYKGEIVSWTTRSINNVGLRYITAKSTEEKLKIKDLLYGEDHVRNAIIVCEGPADVWKIGPGAVATFGTQFTRTQLLKIKKYPIRIVCYDRGAQREAHKLCSELDVFPGRTINIVLTKSKDPGDMNYKEVERLRRDFYI